MRKGFVKEYKGCKIHYVQERFVVTDETNGKLNLNIQN